MTHLPRITLYATLLSQAFGCNPDSQITVEQLDRGCVVLLPGVEGQGWQLAATIDGLRDAGVDQGIEIIPWGTPPLHSLQNLTDLPANLERAERIAKRLAELKRERPAAPLTLVGFSGGGGLAVLSAEALPDDVDVDRIILVAAAISRGYDLTEAQSHCRDKMINFYSRLDNVVGLGTKVFGTIDRKRVYSAGNCGFQNAEGKLLQHDWLVQVAWDAAWLRHGHLGGHIGYLSRGWARHVLAPQIAGTTAVLQ